MSRKRKYSLNDQLRKQYPFLEKRENSNAYCRICLALFTISSGGKYHISGQLKNKKHKKAASSSASAISLPKLLLNNESNSKQLKNIAVAEG